MQRDSDPTPNALQKALLEYHGEEWHDGSVDADSTRAWALIALGYMVIAITSGVKDMQAVLNVVWDKLLPACEKKKLRSNRGAQEQLKAKLAALELSPAKGTATSPLAAKVLNRKFAERGWPTCKIGVGLNSGNVRVGDMGSQVRRAYTAMGDPARSAMSIPSHRPPAW